MTGMNEVTATTKIGTPTVRPPTTATVGSARSSQGSIGDGIVAAATAVGSSVARFASPIGGDAVSGLGGSDTPRSLLLDHRSVTGSERLSLSLPIGLCFGAVFTVMIGVMLRRRSVRLAIDESHESESEGFAFAFQELHDISIEKRSDEGNAWEPYELP